MQTKKSAFVPKKNDFKIKLLSGNNVVLIEANGFESELFVPYIVRGRITLENIIPERRCCKLLLGKSMENSSKSKSPPWLFNSGGKHSGERKKLRCNRQYGGQDAMLKGDESDVARKKIQHTDKKASPGGVHKKKMVFHSTPMEKPNLSSEADYSDKENIPTPEPVRLSRPAPFQVINNTVTANSGLEMTNDGARRALFKNSLQTYSNASPVAAYPPKTYSAHSHNSPAIEQRRMRLPPGQDISNRHSPDYFAEAQKRPPTPNTSKKRHCVIPKHTYSRRSVVASPAVAVPIAQPKATQGVRGTHKAQIKKRKLIIDAKKAISPKAMKIQIVEAASTCRDAKRKDVPGTRFEYKHARETAFELLTTTNHKTISAKLQQQFQNGCIDKYCSTVPKYKKLLVDIPPLKKQLPSTRDRWEEKENLERQRALNAALNSENKDRTRKQ